MKHPTPRCLILLPLLLLLAAVSFAQPARPAAPSRPRAEAPQSAVGTLYLQGSAIQSLTLARGADKPLVFDNPSTSLTLAAGNYAVRAIRLASGPRAAAASRSIRSYFTIRKDEATVLKIGAPLSETLTVRRSGMNLQVTWGLMDNAGNSYAMEPSATPPASPANPGPAAKATFAVSRASRPIATAPLEPG